MSRDFTAEADRITDISMELFTTDFQGADPEQHILAAEAFLNVHGLTAELCAAQELDLSFASMDHLLRRAEVHVQIANARRAA